jgi:Cys-rich repeat protein
MCRFRFLSLAVLGLFVGCDAKDADNGGGGDESDTDTDTDADADTDTDPTGPDPETVELGGSCELAELYGYFKVESYIDYSIVDGAIADGVVPVTILENVGEEGDCTLLRRNNPFCDPACSPDETCDPVLGCVPYPADQDLGTVTVDGLLEEVVMEPISPGFSYFDVQLPHPVYEPGSLITLTSTGAAVEPLEMYGVGVIPLELPQPDLILARDEDLVMTWTPPGGPVRSTVYARVTVDQHGLTPIQLTCQTADDGELAIPASLVTALIDAGVTGFPNGLLVRQTVDSMPVLGDGCAEFQINSPREPNVRVEGFTPCTSDEDCPSGQTCNTAIEICE